MTAIVGLACFSTSCGDEAKKEPAESNMSLDSLIMKHPDSVPLLVKRSQRFIESFDYEGAMNDAAKAFRLDSNDLGVRALYAEVLNSRPTRSIEDVLAAQRHYRFLLKRNPKSPKYLVGLASTHSFFSEFDESFDYLDKALRIDPPYRDAYVLKGSNFGALGNIDLMKSSYETAIQQDPEFFEAYIRLGAIYLSEGNPASIEYYRTAHELKPDIMEAMYSLAYANQQFDRIDEANLLYRNMLKDTSDFYVSQAYFQLGFIKALHESPRDLDSAIYFYTNATEVNPHFHEAYFQLGFCYDQKGNMSVALKNLGESLRLNPDYEPARQFADSLKKLR